jgi:hypothetical protein
MRQKKYLKIITATSRIKKAGFITPGFNDTR